MPFFEVTALSLAEAGGAAAAEAAFADIAAQQAAAAAMESAGIGALGGLSGAGTGIAGVGLGAPAGYEAFLEQLTALNPEVVAQNQAIAQAAAVPPSGPIVGQIPTPTPPITEGIGNLPVGSNFAQPIPAQYQTAMNQLAQGTGQYPGVQLASTTNAVPGALGGGAPTSELAQAAARYPDLYPGSNLSGGSTVFNPSGTAQYSFSGAPETVSTLEARGAAAAPSAATTSLAQTAATPAPAEVAYKTVADTLPPVNPADFGATTADVSPSNPFSEAYDWYKKQPAPVRYGITALGGMQGAKLLNKQPSVAATEKYSGPLSKFRYSPDTYTPYNYRPYAAGGPVERMSNENAIGANTGYPQADIQQGAYATPWQTPVSRNVVAGAGDVGVDQMTGMERMAEGGTAEAAPAMPAVAASQQNFSDFLSRYQGAPEQAGLASFTPTEQSMPAVMASRQNFADFLSRYQNMPVMEDMPVVTGYQPTQYQGLYYTPPGSYMPSSSSSSNSSDSGSSLNTNQMASGGIATLGSYSDGGRLLKGPGDGMSDNIPASIGGKQPARLADGEFVVPADVVSGLGNGSTDAGAKHLYSMMDKVRSARTGTKKQGKQINARKYLPA